LHGAINRCERDRTGHEKSNKTVRVGDLENKQKGKGQCETN